MRRELQDLERLLDKVQNDTKNQKDNSNNNQDNNDMLIKYEFEQLLKYKQNQLNSTTNASKNSADLSSVKQDIEEIQNQVNTLQEF